MPDLKLKADDSVTKLGLEKRREWERQMQAFLDCGKDPPKPRKIKSVASLQVLSAWGHALRGCCGHGHSISS